MIGISLLTLVPGMFGGSATYASALLSSLERFGQLDYVVFTPRIAGLPTTRIESRTVSAYPAASSMPGRLAAMTYASILPGRIRKELELDRLDAIHFPLSIMLPTVGRTPAATTLHDVLHLAAPQFLSRSERVYRHVMYRRSLAASRIVIVASEFARMTLVERAECDQARIRIIPLGVDTETFHADDRERKPFILYPADFYPHKNHRRLLEAFRLVRARRPDLELVLAGRGLSDLGAPGVSIRGRVPIAELAELYRTASALVFPSLHESFGLPPLEAMASGCPVACSAAGALPEVCGDAARYFDPESVDGIADAIVDVVEGHSPLTQAGFERVELFTWQRCASLHEDVYQVLSSMA